MDRETWGSKLGFIFAAVGSAVGLANIVRFPYLVGENGGGAFILVYIICLFVVGFPIFITELTIGRHARSNPYGCFAKLGKTKFWRGTGIFIILIGLVVSSFYSALAGWILGYIVETINGNVLTLNTGEIATEHFNSLRSMPWWNLSFHALFLLFCGAILFSGVRKGLEKFSKILMPLMFIVLLTLVVIGLGLPNSNKALDFLFKVDWNAITPRVILLALGQAFFTVSVGQGTMLTYGSYLKKSDNLINSGMIIVLADTIVSVLASIAVFSIVFSVGADSHGGIGLIFHTLPVVFAKLEFGFILAIAFFVLVALAAITSEISVMEPSISYLVDQWGFSRRRAVVTVSIGAFTLGIPCALSYSVFQKVSLFGLPILDGVDLLATTLLIPVGALLVVAFAGWSWGVDKVLNELNLSSGLNYYLKLCIKFVAPILVLIILGNGIFKLF